MIAFEHLSSMQQMFTSEKIKEEAEHDNRNRGNGAPRTTSVREKVAAMTGRWGSE
jgi:hypothetical protein